MSCQEGHGLWVSTTSSACLATVTGRLERCLCPVSTCAADAYGNFRCEFTWFSIAVIALLFCGLAAAAGLYAYYDRRTKVEDEHLHLIDWKAFNDVMFGVYHANHDHDDGHGHGHGPPSPKGEASGSGAASPTSLPAAAPTERTPLVGATGTQGGTF